MDPKSKNHRRFIECLWGVAKSTIINRSRGSFKDNLPWKLAEQWLRTTHIKNHNFRRHIEINSSRRPLMYRFFNGIKTSRI